MIAVGLDRVVADPSGLSGRRYGVLAHAAAVSADLTPIIPALIRAGAAAPQVMFGPEHGFYGVEQDMIASGDALDPWTGVPVLSLYGEDESSLRPAAASFDDLDLLLIDLQDVGARYYTYAATAVWSAEVALAAGVEVWILDRPNPLGGTHVEGNLRRPGYESFVGAFEMPVRHGLTLGELVGVEARRRSWDGPWKVICMEGWRRDMFWEDTGRAWIPPSPNLPTPHGALLYPGTCLLEGTTLSEGRGTTRPFELLGAPGVDAPAVAKGLSALDLPGVKFLPTMFRPQFQKHAGRTCAGVQVVVTESPKVRPLRVGAEILRVFRQLAPDAFGWRREAYEFVSDRPAIDLLAGDDTLRTGLDGTPPSIEAWVEPWARDEATFRDERAASLLYS